MSTGRKVFWSLVGIYVVGLIALVLIFGFGHRNNAFQIQNEFKLTDWTHWGVLSINRAVVYLFLASILTIATTLYREMGMNYWLEQASARSTG